MLIGSFSPLVKIFQCTFNAEMCEQLKENPDLCFEEQSPKPGWEMRIYKPSGDYPLKWGFPKEESNRVILDWLTGGPDGLFSVETDYTGCVQIPVPIADTGDIFAHLDLFDGKPNVEMRKKFMAAKDKAKELSHLRVMRAIDATYNNLRAQWKTNVENQYAKHQPSVTEYLVLHVKAKLADRKNKIELEQAKKAEQLMKEIEADGLI
jgi:hypothetical protein